MSERAALSLLQSCISVPGGRRKWVCPSFRHRSASRIVPHTLRWLTPRLAAAPTGPGVAAASAPRASPRQDAGGQPRSIPPPPHPALLHDGPANHSGLFCINPGAGGVASHPSPVLSAPPSGSASSMRTATRPPRSQTLDT